ncbi:MAG: hypothetical protein UE295_07340 [Acutalibacteraceae bacterium]|nr:hypothetical protein [Acutalibacteraceae bacterium]
MLKTEELTESNIDDFFRETHVMELRVAERMIELRDAHKEVFDLMDKLSEDEKEIADRKSAVKKFLIDRKDYDVHEDEGCLLRYSLTKISRIDAPDLDKVPEKYKKVETVADVDKALDNYRLTGQLPDGFVDKSYCRLNWKSTSDGGVVNAD